MIHDPDQGVEVQPAPYFVHIPLRICIYGQHVKDFDNVEQSPTNYTKFDVCIPPTQDHNPEFDRQKYPNGEHPKSCN